MDSGVCTLQGVYESHIEYGMCNVQGDDVCVCVCARGGGGRGGISLF